MSEGETFYCADIGGFDGADYTNVAEIGPFATATHALNEACNVIGRTVGSIQGASVFVDDPNVVALGFTIERVIDGETDATWGIDGNQSKRVAA